MRSAAVMLLVVVGVLALAAPCVSPNAPGTEFRDFPNAPPMRVRVRDANGLRSPFVYPLRLVDRLEQRYEEDRSSPEPIVWWSHGTIMNVADPARGPLLLAGTDSFGRDVWARLLYGARTSLAVALIATAGALAIGVLVGGVAGYAGGLLDETLMRLSEFVLVLPGIYVVLVLRMMLPLVLTREQVFVLISGILALAGWPFVARGVRAIVQTERRREYCVAAISLGAGPVRVLARHVLPASAGFLGVQVTILLPAFILAEATLSYVGLGFPAPVPSWGAMLRDASGAAALAEFPWTLAPAAAIFIVVLACNLLVQASGADPIGATPRVARVVGRFNLPVDRRNRIRLDEGERPPERHRPHGLSV